MSPYGKPIAKPSVSSAKPSAAAMGQPYISPELSAKQDTSRQEPTVDMVETVSIKNWGLSRAAIINALRGKARIR